MTVLLVTVVGFAFRKPSRSQPSPRSVLSAPVDQNELSHPDMSSLEAITRYAIDRKESSQRRAWSALHAIRSADLQRHEYLQNRIVLELLELDGAMESGTQSISAHRIAGMLDELAQMNQRPVAQWWLRARLDQISNPDSDSAQIDLLRLAASATPDDAQMQYALFDSVRKQQPLILPEEAFEALERAVELSPDNLRLQLDWLKYLAKARDKRFVDYLVKYSDGFRRLCANRVLDRDSNIDGDVSKLLEEAAGAAETDRWYAANVAIERLTDRVAQTEAFAFDERQLSICELDFLISSDRTLRHRADGAGDARGPGPLPYGQLGEPIWSSPIEPIRDMRFVLTGSSDSSRLAILTDAQLVVLKPSGSAGWHVECRLEMTGYFDQISIIAPNHDQLTWRDAPFARSPPTRVDLVLSGLASIKVVRLDVTTDPAVLQSVEQSSTVRSAHGIEAAAVVDLDGDNDLDVVACTTDRIHLLRQDGDDQPAMQLAETIKLTDRRAEHLVTFDWDSDGDDDLLVVEPNNHQAALFLNVQRGGSRLAWNVFSSWPSFRPARLGVHCASHDPVSDWAWTRGGQLHLASATVVNDRIRPIGEPQSVGQDILGFIGGDVNLDSKTDWIAWTETDLIGYAKRPGGTFELFSTAIPLDPRNRIKQARLVDFDADTDLDLLVRDARSIRLIVNQQRVPAVSQRTWETLQLR